MSKNLSNSGDVEIGFYNLNKGNSSSTINSDVESITTQLNILNAKINAGIQTIANSISVSPATNTNFAPNCLTDSQLRSSAVIVTVGNFPSVQQISATALPLPSGAATDVGLMNLKGVLGNAGDAMVSSEDEGTITSRLRSLVWNVEQVSSLLYSLENKLVGALLSWSVVGRTAAISNTNISVGSRIRSFMVQNNTNVDTYVQLHNSSPVAGTIPIASYRLFSNAVVVLGSDYFTAGGLPVGSNLFVAISSTNATYTAQSSPNVNLTINYT